MNAYFYSDNDVQKGPVSFEDLRKLNISKETLIWRDGMDDWVEAGNLPELSELFSSTPIQTVEEPQQIISTSSENNNTEKEYSEIDNTKMFKNAFFFKGRARRTEFCLSAIAYYICLMVPFLFGEAFGESGFVTVIGVIIFFGGFWFFLSESVRRCHDLDHNGFWILIPYYIFWLIFQNSKDGSNEYGNNPKGNNFKSLY